MKYKNTRTGAVIATSGKISGGDWVEIPVAPAQPEIKENAEPEKKTTAPAKKTPTKNSCKNSSKENNR